MHLSPIHGTQSLKCEDSGVCFRICGGGGSGVAGKAMMGESRLAMLPRMFLAKACCRSRLNDDLET